MIRIGILLLVASIFVSCSSHRYRIIDFWSGKPSADLGLRAKQLSYDDKLEIQEAKLWADRLLRYDYYSWIASDLAAERYDFNKNKDSITGWIFEESNGIPKVFFGSLKGEEFRVKILVKWLSDKPLVEIRDFSDPMINKMAYFQEKAMLLTSRYRNENHPRTNTYTFVLNDILSVYQIPALTTNKSIIYGGGLRVKFNLVTKKLIENVRLHKSSILITLAQNSKISTRTSSITRFPNEVDIFHNFSYKNYIEAQYIFSPQSKTVTSFLKNEKGKYKFAVLDDSEEVNP